MRGRVLGLYRLVSAASPLGLIAGGALASAVGNEVALVIGMALSTPVLLLAYGRSPSAPAALGLEKLARHESRKPSLYSTGFHRSVWKAEPFSPARGALSVRTDLGWTYRRASP